MGLISLRADMILVLGVVRADDSVCVGVDDIESIEIVDGEVS